MMITIGDKFPDFELTGVNIGQEPKDAFAKINNQSYKGKWLVFFFWPKDFTFVCPTEIVAFGEMDEQFKQRNAQVIGASVDSEFVHLAWRAHNSKLTSIPFPMLADVKRELSTSLGIIDKNAGVAQRATFVVDPEGLVRFVYVTDLGVGRNPEEVIRVLDGLQNGGLCPANWKKGESTL